MTESEAIEIVRVNDLIGTHIAFYVEEEGKRRLLVSPAMFSLWQSDKCAFFDALHVELPSGEVRHCMDIGGEL